MTIRVTVWGENVHEQKNKVVAEVYPKAIHGTIAAALNADPAIKATTVTLQDAEHGLTAEKIAQTDVLIWWGHAAHGDVDDKIVERVTDAVLKCEHAIARDKDAPLHRLVDLGCVRGDRCAVRDGVRSCTAKRDRRCFNVLFTRQLKRINLRQRK